MLPIGLQFQTYKQPKKLPMRLEQGPVEAFKKYIYKIANVECPKEDKRKKNKTTKAKKNKTI
jgi:hypothetical protein